MASVERFCVPAIVECRFDAEKGTKKIGGYAAVFNTKTDDTREIPHVIRPGAFTKSIGGDIRAFWQHNPEKILGRTKSGTLTLSQDEKGLAFEITLPDSPTGQDARVAVERGDVSEMSFGCMVLSDEIAKDEDGTVIRYLNEINLLEVSPVTFAAFPSTSAELHARILAFNAQTESAPVVEEPTVEAEELPQEVSDRLSALSQDDKIVELLVAE